MFDWKHSRRRGGCEYPDHCGNQITQEEWSESVTLERHSGIQTNKKKNAWDRPMWFWVFLRTSDRTWKTEHHLRKIGLIHDNIARLPWRFWGHWACVTMSYANGWKHNKYVMLRSYEVSWNLKSKVDFRKSSKDTEISFSSSVMFLLLKNPPIPSCITSTRGGGVLVKPLFWLL